MSGSSEAQECSLEKSADLPKCSPLPHPIIVSFYMFGDYYFFTGAKFYFYRNIVLLLSH